MNGITDQMLRGQPRVDAVLPAFLCLLSRGTPVAHNAAFDVGFLCAEIESAALEPPRGPVLDTRALARQAFPERWSYSLAGLARDFRLQGDDRAHRALADAHTCRRLFGACCRVLGAGNQLPLDELSALSGPLDFLAHAPLQRRSAVLLERARVDGREVEIEYRSSRGETTTRRIRPLTFTRVGSNIAVVAWCSLRNANRTFLLESISSIRPAP